MPVDVESQVRAELSREAGRVQAGDLRPLTVPEASERPGWRALLPAAGRRSVVRWLAPATAVVAVIAVIAAVMVAGAGVHRDPSAAGPAASTPAGRSRFYVSLTFRPKVAAVVHDSRTGRVTGSYRLPPAYQGSGPAPVIAAARSDREFAIAATEQLGHSEADVRILDLRLTRDGRPDSVAVLPWRLTPPGSADYVDGIALSPDGRQLAAAIQIPASGFRPRAEIKVISVRTGATRTWTVAGETQLPLNPSWQAGGRYLGFLLWSRIRGPAASFTARTQLRLLDTVAASRDLMSARVVATGANGRGFLQAAVLSPDGRSVLVAAYRNVAGSRPGHGTAILRVEALRIPGGRLTQVVCRESVRYRNARQMNAADTRFSVLSVAGQGHHALVMCPSLARLDNGSLTTLPGLGQLPIVAW
ncbi:MAG TPA: hypothetical protein VGG35_28320 [Streptosporangiaceae bacterium]|jgi:hypothetical protein